MEEIICPIKEGLCSVEWVCGTDQPYLNIRSAIEVSEYHAIKIKKLKKPELTKWYDVFHELLIILS